MSVNFSKNQEDIINAWRNVIESPNEPKWALFGYEGSTNVIKLMSSGSKGLDELLKELNCSLIQYAFCRVIDCQLGLNKLILINWQGESAPSSRKGVCASHLGDVANYFKGCSQTITIRNDDEATEEHLMEQLTKRSTAKLDITRQQQSLNINSAESLSSVQNSSSNNAGNSSLYKAEVASLVAADRKSFWEKQEEEEQKWAAEERRKLIEKQQKHERDTKERMELEAKKLAAIIEARNRAIDAARQSARRVVDGAGSDGCDQPISIVSVSGPAFNAGRFDDDCVGRRSELLRLERNQETQSLISKGLIKNKRAIFEQKTEQASPSPNQQALPRRSSGPIVVRRTLNIFKSLETSEKSTPDEANSSPSAPSSVDKLAKGFSEIVSVSSEENKSTISSGVAPIKREVESVKLTNDEDQTLSNNVSSASAKRQGFNGNHENDGAEVELEWDPLPETETIKSSPKISPPQPEKRAKLSQDVNGNSEHQSPAKQQQGGDAITTANTTGEDGPLLLNGECSEAIALFDYEAADNTEISFDPEDKIGFIQKVDPGWWQGKVMSGRFKGQIGLFPSNYVKEL